MHGDDTATSLAKVPYRVHFICFLVLWKLVAVLTEWKTTVIEHLHDACLSNERFTL